MIFDYGRPPEPGSISDYLNTDPRFNNPGNLLGPDGIPWTEDDGLRPGANSPALGAGENGEDIGAYAFTTDMNIPPVLQVIGPKTTQAGQRLTFVVSASDADGDSLSYSAGSLSGSLSLSGQMLRWHPGTLPGNAAFNEATAVFTWDTANADVGDHMVVFTVTDDGAPAYSDSETVTIHVVGDPIPIPPTVGQPTARATGAHSIRLTWPAVSSDQNVVRYHVYRNGGASAVATSTGTTYDDTNLTQATTYAYRIKAENASGRLSEDFSNEARATTETDNSGDQIAPQWGNDSRFEAEDVSDCSLRLVWAAATDNTGVTGYEITGPGTEVHSVAGNVTTLVVDGLTAATAYEFRLTAHDAAGNRSNVLSTEVTTAEGNNQAGDDDGGGDGGSSGGGSGCFIRTVFIP